MANVEKYDDLIIGSGIAGKFTAWTRDSRRRMAIVERGLLGGACPNVACLPSKNLIWSAKVISLARRGMEFGLKTDSLSVDMAAVQSRKRAMVRELHKARPRLSRPRFARSNSASARPGRGYADDACRGAGA